MIPLDASWSVLKRGFGTIDFIARECDTMEECLQSMQESFPDMDKEEAIKHITGAKNSHAREAMMEQSQYPNMAAERGDDPKEIAQHHPSFQPPPVEIANIMDSPEEMMENNPNAKNLVSSTGRLPGQEPSSQDPNPLDLSMDKLKGSQVKE